MKRTAVIELHAGIGDCVHGEPVLRHVLASGYDDVHLFCREDAVGIYKEYPNVYDHPSKAKQLKLKLCRDGAVHVSCGQEEHAIPGLHRAFQYAQKICPALGIPMMEGEYPRVPVIPVTRQEQEWGRGYYRAGEDQLRVLFQVDSYRTSKSLNRHKANDILRQLATRNAAVSVISQDSMCLFKHSNIRHIQGLNIRQLLSVAAGADVVLGMDSAPSWLAVAAGIPTIIMFGATNPSLYGYRTGLLRILTSEGDIPCLFCNRTTCINRKCLDSIPTDRIISAVRMLDCPTLIEWEKEPEAKLSILAGYEPKARNGKLNIGIVLRVLARGGCEKHFLDISDALAKMPDVRVKIIALHEYDSKFAGNRMIHRAKSDANCTKYESLYPLLDDNLDAIIFYNDELPALVGSNLPSKPVMVTEVQMVNAGLIAVNQKYLQYVDAVVGCAEYVTEEYKELLDDGRVQWVTIPNYVQAPKFIPGARSSFGVRDGDFVVGMLVRMVPVKGIEEAMRSLDYLPENVKLLIGGSGSDMRTYQRLAQVYRDRVRILGWVSDTDSFYSAIDAALLPSGDEGNSTFVLESALASLPLILTPVGNAPYLFKDGESALFVKKEPASIANAVRSVMTDRQYAKNLGTKAKGCTAQYEGVGIMARMYYDLCKTLIERRA